MRVCRVDASAMVWKKLRDVGYTPLFCASVSPPRHRGMSLTGPPGVLSLLAAKARGALHDSPLDTQAWPHGSEWMSRSAVMPRAFSFGSIARKWPRPPVTNPSGEKPYS